MTFMADHFKAVQPELTFVKEVTIDEEVVRIKEDFLQTIKIIFLYLHLLDLSHMIIVIPLSLFFPFLIVFKAQLAILLIDALFLQLL